MKVKFIDHIGPLGKGDLSPRKALAVLEDLKAIAKKHDIMLLFEQERTSRGRECLPPGFEPGEIPVLSFKTRDVREDEEIILKVIKNT